VKNNLNSSLCRHVCHRKWKIHGKCTCNLQFFHEKFVKRTKSQFHFIKKKKFTCFLLSLMTKKNQFPYKFHPFNACLEQTLVNSFTNFIERYYIKDGHICEISSSYKTNFTNFQSENQSIYIPQKDSHNHTSSDCSSSKMP